MVHGGSWISGGCFVAPAAWLFRFDAQAIGDGGKLRVKLLDDSGGELSFMAYSGGADPASNNPILPGWAVLDLAAGAKVWLGINQASGSTKVIDAARAASRLRALCYAERKRDEDQHRRPDLADRP